MYEVLFSQGAKKQLQGLDREAQKHIISVLERIRVRPEKFIKKLIGDPGYRLRAGDYRVIMDIDKGNLLILVINIGHRKNIYKKI